MRHHQRSSNHELHDAPPPGLLHGAGFHLMQFGRQTWKCVRLRDVVRRRMAVQFAATTGPLTYTSTVASSTSGSLPSSSATAPQPGIMAAWRPWQCSSEALVMWFSAHGIAKLGVFMCGWKFIITECSCSLGESCV
uniref:Uncharacterized protein n=1 Tax=Triticum urartu TaxID=4572 RepID=A0A8R7TVD2_TRIUA